MKRSLPQEYNIPREFPEELQEQNKRVKRCGSSSGLAAMTLLSLALSASNGKLDSSSPLRRTSCATADLNSVPFLVPCDDDGEEGGSENVAQQTQAKRLAPLPNVDGVTALRDSWRTAFKPLPMPPRLPTGLPAGAILAGTAHRRW
jgi:hypothetical protein